MQTHLRANVFECFHQKVGRPHPEFQRPEDMLNRTTPLFHLPRGSVQTILHDIQHTFVFPSLDTSLLAGRAFLFKLTTLAGCSVVTVDLHSILYRGMTISQPSSCRAKILVILLDIDEITFVISPKSLVVGCHCLGHKGRDARLFARQYFWPLEITAVRNHFQRIVTDRIA
jgi:hypothetical protein